MVYCVAVDNMNEVCTGLPVLPLDRPIPKAVLGRRCAISFSSCSDLFQNVQYPRLQRRGGVSYDHSQKYEVDVPVVDDEQPCKADTQSGDRIGFCKIEPDLIKHTDEENMERSSNKKYRNASKLRIELFSSWRVRSLSSSGTTVASGKRIRKSAKHVKNTIKLAPTPHTYMVLDDAYPGPSVGQKMLDNTIYWNFDVFKLSSLLGGSHVNVNLVCHTFERFDLYKKFHIDYIALRAFVAEIEAGYQRSNPYHNAFHAADVTQAMLCFICEPQLLKHLTDLEIMTCLLASVCHDVFHPGVNQIFLIKTNHFLSTLYQQKSVLEKHHIASSLSLIKNTHVLERLDAHQFDAFKYLFRLLILATDMSRQMEFMTLFKENLKRKDFGFANTNDRHFILQIALKCADISNATRQWEVSKKWSERVSEEFFNQGDQERDLKIDIIPLCDRYQQTVAKVQTGFYKFVVRPLYSEWRECFHSALSDHVMVNLEENLQAWTKIEEDQTRDFAVRYSNYDSKSRPDVRASRHSTTYKRPCHVLANVLPQTDICIRQSFSHLSSPTVDRLSRLVRLHSADYLSKSWMYRRRLQPTTGSEESAKDQDPQLTTSKSIDSACVNIDNIPFEEG